MIVRQYNQKKHELKIIIVTYQNFETMTKFREKIQKKIEIRNIRMIQSIVYINENEKNENDNFIAFVNFFCRFDY